MTPFRLLLSFVLLFTLSIVNATFRVTYEVRKKCNWWRATRPPYSTPLLPFKSSDVGLVINWASLGKTFIPHTSNFILLLDFF